MSHSFSQSGPLPPPTLPPPVPSPGYLRDAEWLSANHGEVVRQFPDCWVAVLDQKVVAASADLAEVERRVQESHPGAEPVVALVEGHPGFYANRPAA